MQWGDDWEPGGGRSGRLVLVAVVGLAAIFLLLHLAGVFGGAH